MSETLPRGIYDFHYGILQCDIYSRGCTGKTSTRDRALREDVYGMGKNTIETTIMKLDATRKEARAADDYV